MSTLTIPTRALLGQLVDVARTASDDPDLPWLCAVVLHSDRGEWTVVDDTGDDEDPLIDVIPSDLLVASSTDRYAIGQAHEAAEGRLHRPVVVPIADARVIVSSFRPCIAAFGKEKTHKVQLVLEGDTLTVTEDPDLVPDGLTVSFPVKEGTDYPAFHTLMDPDVDAVVRAASIGSGPPGEVIPPSRGTGISAAFLGEFAAIGKRRRMPLTVYRHHQRRPLVIEIGSAYRGLLMTYRVEEDEYPQVPVFDPGLPREPGPDSEAQGVVDAALVGDRL